MPIYEYECVKCNKNHEVMQKFSDAPLTTCSDCGGEMKKLISNTSFVLKGTGWYATDYASSERKKALDSEKDTTDKQAAESKKRNKNRNKNRGCGCMTEMPQPHVHVPYGKIEEHINFINRHRLNLEIYFNSDSLDLVDAASISRLKDILDYNPSLSIHAPFMDISPGAIDSFVRDATIKRLNQTLDIAEMLKPLSIVFHSGYEKWKYALKIEPWLEKSIETWKPLIERAKHIGTKIAIENIFEDEPSNLKILMENIGSESFGICFDAGHCNLFTKVSPREWLEALNPYIIELHLHDNDKSADQHRPMGEGSFDFKTLFSAVKDNNCIHTIEAHSPEDVLKSLNKFKEYHKSYLSKTRTSEQGI